MRTRNICTLLHYAFLLVSQMKLGRSDRRSGVVLIAAVIAVLLTTPAWADYAAGQEAWEAGRIAEALSEWEAAAAEGDVRAMMTLGRAYQRGVGAPQDYILAHFWFNLAASHDNFRAAAERDSLAELMTVEEQAEARKLLREWRGKKRATVEAEVEVPDPAPSAAAPDIEPPPPRAIKEAQSLLAQLGYSPGPADGIWGRRTSEAYRAFLGDADLPAAETLTPKALRILREIAARQGDAEQPEQTEPAQKLDDALYRAAKAGDLNGLKASLEAGADINQLDKKGWTALMHAVNNSKVLVVEALVEAGADLDVRAADGATALFMSAVLGDPQIVALLMKAGADISIRGPKGKTAVDVARLTFGELDTTSANDAYIAVAGLLRGQSWGETLSWRSTAKDFIALFGREPSANTVDEDGLTDLHLAAIYSEQLSNSALALTNMLIDAGIDVNARDSFNRTPLYFAAWHGAAVMMKPLINHGADVNARDNNDWTPLHVATQGGSVETLKLLIDHGADVNARTDWDLTPLHCAASTGTVKMMKLLIDHGADVNARDRASSTPLHDAASDFHVDEVKLLIDHGADVSVRDIYGDTPLQIAKKYDREETVTFLRQFTKRIENGSQNSNR